MIYLIALFPVIAKEVLLFVNKIELACLKMLLSLEAEKLMHWCKQSFFWSPFLNEN